MRSLLVLLITAVLAAPLPAETVSLRESPQRQSKWKKAWAWSAAALLAASAVDTATSIGHHELNPLLRGPGGQFGARGAAIKFSIAGAMVGAQYFLIRKHPEQAPYAFSANVIGAGALGATALRNARLH